MHMCVLAWEFWAFVGAPLAMVGVKLLIVLRLELKLVVALLIDKLFDILNCSRLIVFKSVKLALNFGEKFERNK